MTSIQRKNVTWNGLKAAAKVRLKSLNKLDEYAKRLRLEIKEIEKQDATAYWVRLYGQSYKYNTNTNGLVLPWVLRMTKIDPLTAEHQFIKQTDMPDIDIDCLPDARDKIKAYAAEKYGAEYVCSVGTWQTYKFKSAMQDAARVLGGDVGEVIQLNKQIPDDVDNLKDEGCALCAECRTMHAVIKCPKCGSEATDGITIGQVLKDNAGLAKFNEVYPHIVDMAVRLVGRIKTIGKHAGGLIISSSPLFGNIPMAISGNHWVSMWTEGRNTQLSKLGYIKWDVLGLRTLQIIHECCKMIEKTRGYKFNTVPWEGTDPEARCAGYYWDDSGRKRVVRMDDKYALKLADDLKTETIFQFETSVQRGILSNGVKSFEDLQIYNALGHPGPIKMIPQYVKRRDGAVAWKKTENKEMVEALSETHGIIVYQEQLQKIWQKFGGFTAPEAEAARKAIAKKWAHKIKGIEEQWMGGASEIIGKEDAEKWWGRMETFGRYAFNKCLSKDTILKDPVCGEEITVEELHNNFKSGFKLLSYCDGDFVPDNVGEVVYSGKQDIYSIELENGTVLETTLDHKFKCVDGEFRTVREIYENDYSIIVQD